MTAQTEISSAICPDLTKVDTYVLDYGGVLAFHNCEPWLGELARLLQADRKRVKALLSETSKQGKAYRLNEITRDKFWDLIKRETNAPDADPSDLERNWALSYQIDPRMLAIAERLRTERGFQVGTLSNSDSYRHDHIERTYGLSRKLDFTISSHTHGIMKPSYSAYKKVLEITDRVQNPERVLYIDDRERNVRPALDLGFQGYVFSNGDNFEELLRCQGIL
jgi:HAD superfamily hydrolase (TIGR01509 family)